VETDQGTTLRHDDPSIATVAVAAGHRLGRMNVVAGTLHPSAALDHLPGPAVLEELLPHDEMLPLVERPLHLVGCALRKVAANVPSPGAPLQEAANGIAMAAIGLATAVNPLQDVAISPTRLQGGSVVRRGIGGTVLRHLLVVVGGLNETGARG